MRTTQHIILKMGQKWWTLVKMFIPNKYIRNYITIFVSGMKRKGIKERIDLG